MEIAEHRAEVGGVEVHWRQAGERPVLYVHGVPTASWDWVPFLDRIGGVAPDLPGFGSSAKPAEFPYSIEGYDRFLEDFCAHVGLERLSLVVHDWGGYRWHRVARAWRTPLVGELTMGFTTRWALRRSIPPAVADRAWEDFDHGTQRAILKLYRSAPEPVLERAGARLGELRCPALVLWPTDDPYIAPEFGQRYADALGGEVELELVDGGHWTWRDRPELVDRVAAFLSGPDRPAAARS